MMCLLLHSGIEGDHNGWGVGKMSNVNSWGGVAISKGLVKYLSNACFQNAKVVSIILS